MSLASPALLHANNPPWLPVFFHHQRSRLISSQHRNQNDRLTTSVYSCVFSPLRPIGADRGVRDANYRIKSSNGHRSQPSRDPSTLDNKRRPRRPPSHATPAALHFVSSFCAYQSAKKRLTRSIRRCTRRNQSTCEPVARQLQTRVLYTNYLPVK